MEFIRFFVKIDLWPMLAWIVILPLFMLPVAPLVWLLMVAIGIAPMTWGGFFFNWLVVSVIFEVWFIYKRVQSNWNMFEGIRESQVRPRSAAVADLHIDDLVRGVATGEYVPKVGSQFGSLWGFDGLMVVESTPEQYAAFGNLPKVQLCHGKPITWLGQEWSVILAYHRGELRQVNIHTDPDDATFAHVRVSLENMLGKAKEVASPQDIPHSVQRRLMWMCRDGVVSLLSTPTYIQVSVGRPVDSQEWKGTC